MRAFMSEGSVVPSNPQPLDSEHIVGVCKWFDTKKAFGFIELPGGGLDVFVHANQLRKSGIARVLYEGEKVRFRISKGPKGSFAVDISIVTKSE
jgi:CspA family cold shock protein